VRPKKGWKEHGKEEVNYTITLIEIVADENVGEYFSSLFLFF
jgi:hypothetical protein